MTTTERLNARYAEHGMPEGMQITDNLVTWIMTTDTDKPTNEAVAELLAEFAPIRAYKSASIQIISGIENGQSSCGFAAILRS